MILTHIVFHEFLSGIGGAQVTPEPEPEPTVVEEATRPRPDDGGGRKRLSLKGRTIYKPTGLVDRPRTVRERVEDTAELAREVTERVAREFIEPEPPPVAEMTREEVEREIGILLRKRLRTEEDDLVLLLLMAAAAAG